jgi:hypothetical protein
VYQNHYPLLAEQLTFGSSDSVIQIAQQIVQEKPNTGTNVLVSGQLI